MCGSWSESRLPDPSDRAAAVPRRISDSEPLVRNRQPVLQSALHLAKQRLRLGLGAPEMTRGHPPAATVIARRHVNDPSLTRLVPVQPALTRRTLPAHAGRPSPSTYSVNAATGTRRRRPSSTAPSGSARTPRPTQPQRLRRTTHLAHDRHHRPPRVLPVPVLHGLRPLNGRGLGLSDVAAGFSPWPSRARRVPRIPSLPPLRPNPRT